MKNKVLNHNKSKYCCLVLLIFLSLKYYLFSDFLSAEIPWFGLNTIFSSKHYAFTFLLSIFHLVLCTAVLLKIRSLFPENRFFLFLLVTDPFYLTSFCASTTLLVAILFEISLLAFSKKNSTLNTVLLCAICLVISLLTCEKSFGFIPFIILVYYFLTEKMISYKKAKFTLLFGILSTSIGYVLSFIIRKTPQIMNPLSRWLFDYAPSSSSETRIYKIVFCVILVLFEIIFWVNQLLTCTALYKKVNKESKKRKNKNSAKSKVITAHFMFDFILGLIACLVPLITLISGNVYDSPTVMLSIVICMFIFNCKAPNKINAFVSNNSLPLAIIVITVYSFITKGLFDTSEIMGIINEFAPM